MQKNDFGKQLFKLINNAGFAKIKEYGMKPRDIKLVTTKEERIVWCRHESYNKTFADNFSAIEMKKTQVT